jgi:hypothetical protein
MKAQLCLCGWTQRELVMRLQQKLNGKKSFILNDNSNPWLTNSKADKDKSPYCYIIRIDLNIVDHSLIRICNRDYMC